MAHLSFDLEFQKYLIAAFITEEKYAKENIHIFSSKYFNDDILSGIVEEIKKFIENHKTIPEISALSNELKSCIAPGRKFTEYQEVVEEIYERRGHNIEYYRSKLEEFAHIQTYRDAIGRSLELLEEGDIASIPDTINKAASRIKNNSRTEPYDYFSNLQDRAKHYLYLHKHNNVNGRIATGLYPLDERIQGGLGAGETGVIVGLPKHGKTTTLVNLAVNSLLKGKEVLYVTLELKKQIIASKFDTRLVGRSLEDLKKKPKSFYQEVKKLKEKITGKLTIVEYPTKSMTLHQLQSEINKVNPQVVFVDYASLLRSTLRSDEKRHITSDIHEGLRRVAGECNVPIWTAHQANRPGFDKKVLGMEHTSEDINVPAICDVCVSINQTPDERRRGYARLFVMGNRLGASEDIIPLRVNWVTSQMNVAMEDSELE